MFSFSILLLISINCFVLNGSSVSIQSAAIAQDNNRKRLTTYNDDVSLRLPNDTRPLSYDIELTSRIDQENFTFDGFVRIELVIVNQINKIVLHSLDLNIETITLWTTDSIPSAISITHSYDNYTEFLTIIILDEFLLAGEYYNLDIKYSGELSTDTRGFYRSYYNNSDGQIVYLATTKFAPSSARQAFPCYDEPAIKAKFTIAINHGRNYRAISNMPESITFNDDNETAKTIFRQTPVMSTYLVAFVISDFHSIQDTSNNMVHRSFARSTAITETQLSLDVGIRILEAIEQYLTIPFTLPKIDQISIPHFASAAMENWGLITYSERYLLYNANITYYDDLTEIILTISHEYIHQWFGNLVTTKWWSQTWLNEGFANYFEYYITNLVFSEWKMMEYFVYNNLQTVLITDANANTLPMTHYVEQRTDVSGRFNYVSYAKSGSVIRMFVNAFSDESFTKGLIYYLNEMQFDNAVEEDLFENLQIAVSEDQILSDQLNVQDIFSSWSQQPGYPLLTVTRNYEDDTIELSQERYLTEADDSLSVATWWIPYNYASAIDPDFSSTLPMGWFSRNTSMLLSVAAEITDNDWIVFNNQATGYYRIQYDNNNWRLIVLQLNSNDYWRIHVYNRAQLIDDSFTFAKTNRLSWHVTLDIMAYTRRETEYVVWAAVNRHIQFLRVYMRASAQYEKYREFIRDRIVHVFEYIGINDIENEPHLNKYLRTIAIDLACTYDLENCIENVYNALYTITNNDLQVHPNLANVLYCAAMRKRTFYLYDTFRNRLAVTSDALYRRQLIMSLGCTRIDSCHEELFTDTIRTTSFRLTISERSLMLSGIYRNSLEGLTMTLEFLKENIDDVYTSYTEVELNNHIIELSKIVTTEVQINAFRELLQIYESKVYVNETVIGTAELHLNETENWLDRNLESINDWLENFYEEPLVTEPINPTTTDAPVTNDPVTDDPVTDDPATDDPVTDDPVTDDPGTAIVVHLSKFAFLVTLFVGFL